MAETIVLFGLSNDSAVLSWFDYINQRRSKSTEWWHPMPAARGTGQNSFEISKCVRQPRWNAIYLLINVY